MADRGLPDYTTGTITATNSSRSVTGSGTGWTTTINGVTEVTIGKGDMLIVGTGRPVMVESVESATALTLTEVWPNSTATGTAYKIRRYVALPTGTVLAAVQALEARGTDTNALTSWTIDGGTTRLKLRQAAGGQAALSVGTTGAADGSLLDAILISSAGNVGLGIAPTRKLHVSGAAIINGTGNTLYIGSTNNDYPLEIRGSTSTVSAFIGNPSDDLAFYVGGAEKARVTDTGYFCIGNTTDNPVSSRVDGITFYPAGRFSQRQSNAGTVIGVNEGSGSHFTFFTDAGSVTQAGVISSSGSTTTYSTTSDRRLKTDIRNLTGSLERIRALKAKSHLWINDPMRPRAHGFIADEAQKVVPQAVIGEAGAVDEKGGIIPQGIDYSMFVPDLWAAVGALDQVVAQILGRVANLEERP